MEPVGIICFSFWSLPSQQLSSRAIPALNSCIFVQHSQHFLLSCSYLWSGVAPGLVSYSLFITPCTAIDWLPNTPLAGGNPFSKMWQQKPGRLPWTLHHPWLVVLNQWKQTLFLKEGGKSVFWDKESLGFLQTHYLIFTVCCLTSFTRSPTVLPLPQSRKTKITCPSHEL